MKQLSEGPLESPRNIPRVLFTHPTKADESTANDAMLALLPCGNAQEGVCGKPVRADDDIDGREGEAVLAHSLGAGDGDGLVVVGHDFGDLDVEVGWACWFA